jgi:hypothetical protein
MTGAMCAYAPLHTFHDVDGDLHYKGGKLKDASDEELRHLTVGHYASLAR